MDQNQLDLTGKRVLVTGGTGFIGSRLVERLVRQCGADVRVMVRKFARAARVARYPVELVPGDVTDDAQVDTAVAGCDIVFHCAYGSDGDEARMREVSVGGTEKVLGAARKHGVGRVVHVSTINVYGATPDGPLDESAPRQYFGDVYSDGKLDAEKAAMASAAAGAAVTVVQPTIVYGPSALAWTLRILNDMLTGRVMMINGGDGACNAVYVDDLIGGMLLAAVRPEAVGECFLLSGAEPVTWADFYGNYERMLGMPCTAVISAADAKADFNARFKPQRRRSVMREALSIMRHHEHTRHRVLTSIEGTALLGAAKLVLPGSLRRSLRDKFESEPQLQDDGKTATERPIHATAPSGVDVQASKTVVKIDKARRLLGYAPQFDLETGMQRTEQWARWAGLLG